MDTGTGRSFPRDPVRGPHRCRCWCRDLDYKHRSLRNVVRQNRCSIGTHTPPSRHPSNRRPCRNSRRSPHNYRFSWSPLAVRTVSPTARRPLVKRGYFFAKLIKVKNEREKMIPDCSIKEQQSQDVKLKYAYANKQQIGWLN